MHDTLNVSWSDDNLVPLAVELLEMAWRPEADELSIDHDCNLVAERLSLVHSVSGQEDRGVPELLQHLEQASASNWVHSCSRLIKEFNLGIGNQRYGTAELSLVSTTKLACLLITEGCQV